MTRRLLLFLAVGLLASLAACGGSETDVAPTTTADDQAVAVTEKDLVHATWAEGSLTLDMHAPAKPADAPIVIYLPERGGDTAPPWIVAGLVDEGAFVFVVRYAAFRSPPEQILADHGADAGAQAESVACGINYARAQASKFGNNDPVVVLTGFSNGGALGAHAALFGATLEARWDEYAAEGGPPRQVECEITDGSTHVDALVSMGGPYDVYVPIYDGGYGRAYQQERDPELWEFLSSSIGANPDLKVRLIHGTSDFIPVEDAAEFEALLTDAGYDVELVTFDGGHEIASPELLFPTVMEVLGR
jgi:predicted esterase